MPLLQPSIGTSLLLTLVSSSGSSTHHNPCGRLLGFNGTAVGIYGAIYIWHSFVLHANVRLPIGPLRWIIASPEFHHWHHANQPEAYNKNYAGQLALLDVLFGTARMPKGELPSKYGVDDPVPDSYLAHLAYPFVRVWRRIQRKRRAQLKKRVIAESK